MKTQKVNKLQLGSIEDEAAKCRAAFKGVKVGAFVLHCHHEVLGETLTEDAENRIAYILSSKGEHERALRLHLFRPVSDSQLKKFKKANADRQKADADWKKADADWKKANADWKKAYADWKKANADWKKADADWKKADADWKKAYADRQKANADLAIVIHAKKCRAGCPWDGKTIFPKG